MKENRSARVLVVVLKKVAFTLCKMRKQLGLSIEECYDLT